MTTEVEHEKEAVTNVIWVTFIDVLRPGQDFYLQVKSEEWGVFWWIFENQMTGLYSPGVVNVTLSESLFPKVSVTVMVAVCSPGSKSNTSMSSISKPTGGEI